MLLYLSLLQTVFMSFIYVFYNRYFSWLLEQKGSTVIMNLIYSVAGKNLTIVAVVQQFCINSTLTNLSTFFFQSSESSDLRRQQFDFKLNFFSQTIIRLFFCYIDSSIKVLMQELKIIIDVEKRETLEIQ